MPEVLRSGYPAGVSEVVGRITVPPPFQTQRETWDDLAQALMTGVNTGYPSVTLDNGGRDAFIRISRLGLYDAFKEAGVTYQLCGNSSGEPDTDRWIEVVHHVVALKADPNLAFRLAQAHERFTSSAVAAASATPRRYVFLLGALEASVQGVQDDAFSFGWKQRLEVHGAADGPSRDDEEAQDREHAS